MKWTPNPFLEKRMLERLRHHFGRERAEIHVSDLTLCLLQAFFIKTNPKPPTMRQLSFFVDGESRHKTLEVLFDAKEQSGEKMGVMRTVDAFDEEGFPVEFKTTRAPQARPHHYERQLAYYLIMTDKPMGRFIIQRLKPLMGQDEFECFDVEFSDGAERAKVEGEFIQRRDVLKKALETNSARELPRVKFNEDEKWVCASCQYRVECDQISEKEGEL